MDTDLHALLKTPLDELARKQPRWGRLYGASLALALAELARTSKRFVVIIAPDSHTADQLAQEVDFFSRQASDRLFHLPDWETLPYDLFSPHEDTISQRLEILHALPQQTRGVLIVPVNTLLQRLAPQAYLLGHSFDLGTGDQLDLERFRERLGAAGYRTVQQVMTHGEVAYRGSLVDVFPMGSRAPYRLDLFDDEIESIRSFDPETQASQDKVKAIKLLPAHEFPLDEAGIKGFRRRYRERFEGDPQKSQIYASVSNAAPVGGIEYYLPLFFEQTATLFDYLPQGTLLCHFDALEGEVEQFHQEVAGRYEQRRHDLVRPILAPQEIYLTPEELRQQLAARQTLEVQRFEQIDPSAANFATQALPDLSLKPRQEAPLQAFQTFLAEHPGRVLLTTDSTGRREHLLDTLRPFRITPKPVADWNGFLSSDAPLAITVAQLETGVALRADGLSIVSESQLFGERATQQRRRRKPTRDADAIVRNLTDLTPGAPVVHEDNGVGRYLGLQRVTVGEVEAEFLLIEYAGGDKLYVPVASLHLVSRYTGADPEHAPLHRLGTDQWSKARRKAAQKARDVAAELLEIHARRAARKGYAYTVEDLEYRAFASTFPFEETEDQQNAIDAVLADLASDRPTDRVVCGDVGFGKTEVAMRAAFVVANGGRQVVVLVPTTLLAQQHTQNFADRFSDWPLRIESLSRFRTAKEQKQVLDALAQGTVDIVIGTHRLLQGDVKFKNLGLVIVDEEHRFGVRDKERLKALRAEVDLLTLTATPIPRTLNMSLAGLRDLSIIATPPVQRHAIKTFVAEWDRNLVSEACLREIRRGGQVYYLHNEVKTIEKRARELAELVPEATIRFAHGQMRETELEHVMLDFYHQRFNILVSTTIIESGIDVPSANTIVIDRADKFGLSQLHQLRGRVGRSHHRAYAYLLVPEKRAMTADAVKRLEAIEALEDLGVGFTLATHDLEIRGAGELLGEEQSGQIQEIGFNLYNELLQRAVKALKSGQMPDALDAPAARTEVDLGLPALLPEDYVNDVHTRLILYKRIAAAQTEGELHELQVELIDRFGLLPEAAKNLFTVTQLKLKAVPLGIRKIDVGASAGRVLFDTQPKIDVARLIGLIQKAPKTYKLEGQEKLRFFLDDAAAADRVAWLENLLQTLRPAAAATAPQSAPATPSASKRAAKASR
ncbi:MAG: transcription-repair coupling factor [Thiotrichales bacterium]